MKFVVNGIPLSGSNAVDLLKCATADQDPRGEEPHGSEDFFNVLRDIIVPSSLVHNSKRRRMLTTGNVTPNSSSGKSFSTQHGAGKADQELF